MKNLWFEVKEYSTWKVVCSNARHRRVVYLLVTVSSSFGQSLGNGRRTSSLFAFTVYSIKIKKLQSNMLGEALWNFFERKPCTTSFNHLCLSTLRFVLLFLKFFLFRERYRKWYLPRIQFIFRPFKERNSSLSFAMNLKITSTMF